MNMKKYIVLLIVLLSTINTYAQFNQYDKIEYNGYTPLSTEEIMRPAKIMYERGQSNAQKIDALVQYIFEIKKQITEPAALKILDSYYQRLRKYAAAKDLAAPYMSDFIRETQWDLQEYIDDYNRFQKSNYYCNQSMEEMKNGNYQQALALINNAIQISPVYFSNYYLYDRGFIFLKLNDFPNAINDLNIFLGKYPDSKLGYLYRAEAYDALKSYQNAINDYSRCLSLDNNNTEAYYRRGLLYYKNGMYQQCINDMNNVISRNISLGNSYYMRAIAKIALNNNQDVCSDLRRAVELGVPEAQEAKLKYCN